MKEIYNKLGKMPESSLLQPKLTCIRLACNDKKGTLDLSYCTGLVICVKALNRKNVLMKIKMTQLSFVKARAELGNVNKTDKSCKHLFVLPGSVPAPALLD